MEPSIVLPMSYDPPTTTDDDIDCGPSKSELKRQSQGLQDLGEELIGLPQAEFDAIELAGNLREPLPSRAASPPRRPLRQKQYIGKLMRKIDAEPIRKALEAQNLRQRSETLRLRKVEAWRAKLIEEALRHSTSCVVECPGIDRGTVTRLVAQAVRERDRGQPPRASRELFAVLRDALAE